MQKEKTKMSIKRSNAPAMLIQRFFNEFDEVVTHYELQQQIELCDYMLAEFELIREFENSQDEKLLTEIQKKENALIKKFGKALKPFMEKGFNKYFMFDMAIVEKNIVSTEQYNNLPPGTQSLSKDEINFFLTRCMTALNSKRNYLYLRGEPEFEITKQNDPSTPAIETEDPDKESTRSKQMLAMYYLLRAGFGIEARSSNSISQVARLVHLMTATRYTNIQNSEIYKKFRQVPNHKKGLPLIGDLKSIRSYFDDLGIIKATELIDKEIELAVKELSSVDKKKLLKEKQ